MRQRGVLLARTALGALVDRLGFVEVAQHRARSMHARRSVLQTQPLDGTKAILLLDRFQRLGLPELPTRTRRERRVDARSEIDDSFGCIARDRGGVNQLSHTHTPQLIRTLLECAIKERERAGGEFNDRDARVVLIMDDNRTHRD